MFKNKKYIKFNQPKSSHDVQDSGNFDDFFVEVTDKMPRKSAQILKSSYSKLKNQAEKTLEKTGDKFDHSFDSILKNLDAEKRSQCHKVIHSATLMAAIVTLSPIPLTDSAMLVPIQVVMMSRLHKIFGATWREGMAWSIAKETFLLAFVREIPGNLMKIIPFFGTAAGSVANVTVSVLITETLGWVTVNMLNNGEDIFSDKKAVNKQVKNLLSVMAVATNLKTKK
ncbi:DUF697 domain-containing protein [Lactococcus fujiensis]|uniref:GTPase n=1 Tax=Lactococcus fujiensis JCM 16395 TaxID=1291764 RepID=A0A2A5RKX1_9LACT|nr:DUF697 domain-containing protein [Lactococcus fujiensis]PCR99859.1 hypothetical protein RT41_GL001665 [Lactococcus fujiensis JCM 16395]